MYWQILAGSVPNWHIPAITIFVYLAVVLYIGIFAFRRTKTTGEDFFLASRSIGPIVFFLSLFATNMTAFAMIGSSGMAYKVGIGVFGLMASSSCFIIPLTLLVVGTRLWSLGKRFGHMTQVQFFRDRWECSSIGTLIFSLTALMLLPYLIISVSGGGIILEQLTSGHIPFRVGGAIVALVVMGNVFFGGMRGAVLVNIFQTLLFLSFGCVAFLIIAHNIPNGLGATVNELMAGKATRYAMTRDRMTTQQFLSYMFIPLSSIMFPHMAIMCMTAKKVTSFKKTVIFYPLSIMLLWLPCVFLGALAVAPSVGIHLKPNQSDQVLLAMLAKYVPETLAGILGAGIISAVMGSDCHQILALSTMFTKDVFDYHGGKARFGERGTVFVGRTFIIIMNTIAYLIAIGLESRGKLSIFELAVQYAFSGFAALSPVMLAALFWKRSTKFGALAATVFVAACILGQAWLENHYSAGDVILAMKLGGNSAMELVKPTGALRIFGYMTVVPMVLGSTVCVILFSLLTSPPSRATIEKYFD